MYILEVFVKVLNDVDNVIKIIKDVKNFEDVRNNLIVIYDFIEI